VARWSWLAGTYWYVPPANLPAILYSPSDQTILPQADQTVFQITGYRNGYFWGVVVTQLGSMEPTTSSMIGSITPQGSVLLNFTQADGSSGPAITQGIGRMRVKYGGWTMENQMFTSPSDQLQVGHWAYMVRTRPGLPSWESLPGVGVSVPEFLGGSAGQGPQPVTATAGRRG
jgi:hypothetical protein